MRRTAGLALAPGSCAAGEADLYQRSEATEAGSSARFGVPPFGVSGGWEPFASASPADFSFGPVTSSLRRGIDLLVAGIGGLHEHQQPLFDS